MRLRAFFFTCIIALAATLTGCSSLQTTTASSAAESAAQGTIHGGQQPVAGAAIQLYAVGTTGDGSPATPLFAAATISDSAGGFSFPHYTCPSPATLVYLVGTGGNPGLAPGTNNPQSVLVSALGPCGSLSATSFISLNEVSTVASLFPLSPYTAAPGAIGSGNADHLALTAAFATVNSLVNPTTGLAPGAALPPGLTTPVANIYTLADVVSTCVNSSGGSAGDNNPCGRLFTLATPPGGKAPTDTATALANIFANPSQNLAAIFGLAPSNGPYQPSLTSLPTDWSLHLSPTLPASSSLLAAYLLTEGTGAIAHDSSGNGNDAAIAGPAWEGAADLNFQTTGRYLSLPTALNRAKSWQFALYEPPTGTATAPLAPGWGDYVNFGANPSILCGTDLAHLCLIAGTPGVSPEFSAFTTDLTQAGVPLSPGWHIVSFLCGNATALTHILYDGVEVPSYVHQGGASTCPTPTSGNYQIGGSSILTGTWFVGKLAAAWAWSQPLTVPQASVAAAAALAFVQSKGIATSFDHAPNVSPLILTGFDSRTEGYLLNTPADAWPQHLQLDRPAQVVNLSSSGATAFDLCAQFDTLFGEQIPPNSAQPPIVVLWGGVNDFDRFNVTPVAAAASLQCAVGKARAWGARVIMATEISSLSSGTIGDPGKNALDPILRASALAWGAENIADLATDPTLGADGASGNTACFVEGIHLNSACEPRVTAIMQNAINEITGSTAAAPHATAAATYQELAGDRFLTLTGSTSQSVTLPSCIGYALPRTITASPSASATVLTANSQTLTGSSIVSAATSAVFTPTPGPVKTGGCTWTRTN